MWTVPENTIPPPPQQKGGGGGVEGSLRPNKEIYEVELEFPEVEELEGGRGGGRLRKKNPLWGRWDILWTYPMNFC